MFFFFLQNVQPNFLLLMVVFLLFSFVKFHFCHISSEVFLLLYIFFIHMASVALLGAHLALSGYALQGGDILPRKNDISVISSTLGLQVLSSSSLSFARGNCCFPIIRPLWYDSSH